MDQENPQNPTPKKRDWENAFLEALRLTGIVSHAARAAGIDRTTAYGYRDECPEFARAWEQAKDDAADLLVLEARRRAHDGVDEPVYYKGESVGAVRKYSDTLLIFLIKGAKPEYRDKVEHQGGIEHKHSGKVELDVFAQVDAYAAAFDEAAQRELSEETTEATEGPATNGGAAKPEPQSQGPDAAGSVPESALPPHDPGESVYPDDPGDGDEGWEAE